MASGGGLELFGKRVSGPFTVPSGIVTVTLDTIKLLADTCPELGVLTTKSIGPVEREGNREPVYASLEGQPGAWVNAVGLANPGCDLFVKELAVIKPQLPADRCLLISIMGGNEAEFARVASVVGPYADALELNFSCPHAEGFGQAICATPDLAAKILVAIRAVSQKPLVPKLSPNLSDEQLENLVPSLLKAGAAGFTAINTFGPVDNPVEAAGGINCLSKGKGGMSGPAVLDRGLTVVRNLRRIMDSNGAQKLPIIGMGGIATAGDVEAFARAGAACFGVGSALTGMSTAQMCDYFRRLNAAFRLRRRQLGPGVLAGAGASPAVADTAPPALPPDYMLFRRYTLDRAVLSNPELGVFYFREPLPARPGQFVQAWVPGEGEKPFAQATTEPFSLAVRDVGILTKHFFSLKPGAHVYIRGPYGNGFTVPPAGGAECAVLVGGGTGIAPLHLLTQLLSRDARLPKEKIHVYLGGRGHEHFYLVPEFEAMATVHIATDDGTRGFKGRVGELLERDLGAGGAAGLAPPYRFYNCGPELMMRAAFDIQTRFPRVAIEASIERYMKCGVGICGVCSCDGLRMCVDGPILNEETLAASKQFGKIHRAKTTKLLEW